MTPGESAVHSTRAPADAAPTGAADASPGDRTRRIPSPPTPFLLDFFPLEEPSQTRLSPFFEGLREGEFRTTRCRRDGTVHWPPRVACPDCHQEELDWIDLPKSATVYAFSAILAGAPMGMEKDLPIVVGLVDLEGEPLRIFTRISGRPWEKIQVGDRVQFEPLELEDGRRFFGFRWVSHAEGA
jgi:uncharacterized protein